jgi:TolA-binding protein
LRDNSAILDTSDAKTAFRAARKDGQMSHREEPLDVARIYAVAEEHLKIGELDEARQEFRRAFQYGADPSLETSNMEPCK